MSDSRLVSARRERNWKRKYAAVMLSSPELRRLRDAIEALSTDSLDDLGRSWIARSREEIEMTHAAGRHATRLYGLARSHDVMCLANYAATQPASPAWETIAHAALGLGALPFGLSSLDFHRLVGPLARDVPWLTDLA